MDKERKSKVKSCIGSIVLNLEKIASKHSIYLRDKRRIESNYAGETLVAERNKLINDYCSELNVASVLIKENLNKIEECLEQEDEIDITDPAFNSAVNILSSSNDLSPEIFHSIIKNFGGKNKELRLLGNINAPAYESVIKAYMYDYKDNFRKMRDILRSISLYYDGPYDITDIRVELRKIATIYGIDWEDNESADYYDLRMRNIATRMNLDIDKIDNLY